ncbi:MAG: MBOAT family protein, partial [Atopobiaceae bacterium]|nr:MBOAT family protein [Atopobiaceae bacterium]
FTFQALSYVIDVYRGDAPGDDSVWKVLLYISFFPQIIAGPIVKYHDIEQQIDNRTIDVHESALGMRRFILGLSKKVLIANSMGFVADSLFGYDPVMLNAPAAWLGAIAYLMQIYFDFSAYSDMAIGLGHLFGFTILENFDHPYASVTIKEFWRRWHISLSTWFKEYLYIPLGGNRKGKLRAGINKCIVFFLCGLWHGASWTFVVWGLIHGAFSLLEEVVPIKRLPRALGHVYTLVVVMLAFVFFRADTLGLACTFISRMIVGWDLSREAMIVPVSMLTPEFLVALAAAVVTCVPPRVSAAFEGKLMIASFAIAFVLLALCILELSGGTYNPFIYFRF